MKAFNFLTRSILILFALASYLYVEACSSSSTPTTAETTDIESTGGKRKTRKYGTDALPSYNFTLWVETNDVPDTTYYDDLATVITSNPNLNFGKVLLRINGDGAAVSEPWYDSMNPAGNGGDPYVLELLKKLEGKNVVVYAVPYLSKVVKPTDDENWDIYAGMADDAPALQSWWTSLGVSDSYYAGSLKQSVRWVGDMNSAAANQGISTRFTGIVFEPEGSPYPNDERTLQAIATYKQTYNLPNLKVGITGDSAQGYAYSQYGKDGVLDEGYLQLYNLTDVPAQDPGTTYIDAMAEGALTTPTYPVFPSSTYSQAWLENPSSAGETVWSTDGNNWKPGQILGFQHSHVDANNIGLLSADFYNEGNGYSYKCSEGEVGCPKIYFMFSTECGDADGNIPSGIQCNCLMTGCPQSRITAFGAWSDTEGVEQFFQFLDLANEDWQLPTDQFAIFQYQLLPKAWVGQ